MKVLISDYIDRMMPDHEPEVQTLQAGLGDNVEVDIWPYTDEKRDEFYARLHDADALLTAFIPIDAEAFDHAPSLKVIAIDATGYDNVDLDEATKRGVGVCPVGEYCTWDVSEAAIAYFFALNKLFKFFAKKVECKHEWAFADAPAWPRLEDQTLGIVGFGKIGTCTARKAKGLFKDIIANDPFIDPARFAENGVRQASVDELLATSDIIVNHMNLNETNYRYFDAEKFSKMKRHPILVNLGRGLSVDEDALVEALDTGAIRAFGADVLSDETPNLEHHPLMGRDNVIITPHSALYSSSSLHSLQTMPAANIAAFLSGRKEDVFKLVNDVEVRDFRR